MLAMRVAEVRADRAGVVDRSSGRLGRALKFVREQGPLEVIRLIRQHGVAASARFVTRNVRHSIAHTYARRFDRRYGVDTAGSIQLNGLDIIGPNGALGNEAVCTSPKSFKWLMDRTGVPPDATFIDIGSGKSRTVLLASLYGFRRAIGVEFARELVEVSRANVEGFAPYNKSGTAFEIVHADATTYEFPLQPLVVYFYNPFRRELLEEVLRNLATSLQDHPRPCLVIYATSQSTINWALAAIAETASFTKVESGRTPFFADAVRTLDYGIFRWQPIK